MSPEKVLGFSSIDYTCAKCDVISSSRRNESFQQQQRQGWGVGGIGRVWAKRGARESILHGEKHVRGFQSKEDTRMLKDRLSVLVKSLLGSRRENGRSVLSGLL